MEEVRIEVFEAIAYQLIMFGGRLLGIRKEAFHNLGWKQITLTYTAYTVVWSEGAFQPMNTDRSSVSLAGQIEADNSLDLFARKNTYPFSYIKVIRNTHYNSYCLETTPSTNTGNRNVGSVLHPSNF